MQPADYLDLAIKKQGLKSDRELSRALELKSNNTMTNMRSGKHLPSDDTMIKIAELAGEPVDVALLRLNLWRSKTPETREHYAAIAERLAKQASSWLIYLGLGIMVLFSFGSNTAHAAGTITEQASISILAVINCATNFLGGIARILRKLKPRFALKAAWAIGRRRQRLRGVCEDQPVISSSGSEAAP